MGVGGKEAGVVLAWYGWHWQRLRLPRSHHGCPESGGKCPPLMPTSPSSRESEDTVLLVLKEIYQTQGITLDQPLPGSQ